MQAGPRLVGESNTANNGWIEWAFVIQKNSDPVPVNTNIGTQTLGDICTKYFRNQCIYTGNMPVGGAQPNSQEIDLKIPKSMMVLHTGDEWVFYFHPRTVSTTETGTSTFRVVTSFNYINYH